MRLFVLSAVSVLYAGAAFAQEGPLQKVYACAGVENADERLACYDSAVDLLKEAEAAGGVAVVTSEQLVEAEKQAFGLRQPSFVDVARATAPATATPEEPDSIAAKISAVAERADGRLRFILDNGQVWEQVERSRLSRTPAAGTPAEVKKAMIGSYMLSIEGLGRSMRVRRVQ